MVKNPVSLGIKATHKYDDIIYMEYPFNHGDVMKHPRMAIDDRAKIFAPFAALRGYEEAIESKQKIVVPRMELSEESKDYLDVQLERVRELLVQGQHPIVTVIYFQSDELTNEECGDYIQFTGMVAKFDQSQQLLQVVEKKFLLKDIYGMEVEQ